MFNMSIMARSESAYDDDREFEEYVRDVERIVGRPLPDAATRELLSDLLASGNCTPEDAAEELAAEGLA